MVGLMKTLGYGIGVAMLSAGSLLADVSIWSAEKANMAVQAGELILLDIRTPAEWAATGVAQGAWPLDLQNKAFAQQLQTVLSRNKDREIGFICATGARSAYVAKYLDKVGVKHSIDVSEGMNGSRAGAGWVKDGLPVVSAKAALNAMPHDLVAK